MEQRQEKILEAIIKEYVKIARPISSGHLVGQYNFGVGPATLRADMKELEKEKFLHQPHTSAGRVPTDKGYRFFINSLMKKKELTSRERQTLKRGLANRGEVAKLMPRITSLLAELSCGYVISGLSNLDQPSFFRAGLSRLLREPECAYNQQIIETLDYLDKHMANLFEIIEDRGIDIFVGRENPIKEIKGFSLVISGQQLKSGQKGLIAILGPRRMRYNRNIALLEYMNNLLENI